MNIRVLFISMAKFKISYVNNTIFIMQVGYKFSIFILSGKKGKSLWSSGNFSGYWTSVSIKHLILLSSLKVFMKSSLDIFSTHLKPP